VGPVAERRPELGELVLSARELVAERRFGEVTGRRSPAPS
jgi:hypothetical protein